LFVGLVTYKYYLQVAATDRNTWWKRCLSLIKKRKKDCCSCQCHHYL